MAEACRRSLARGDRSSVMPMECIQREHVGVVKGRKVAAGQGVEAAKQDGARLEPRQRREAPFRRNISERINLSPLGGFCAMLPQVIEGDSAGEVAEST